MNYNKSVSGSVQSLLPSLSYDYDAKGNITHVYENDVLKIRYHYDGLNRLVREDNSDIDKTVVYNYDRFGNILSKVEYALTFGELGAIVNTIPYEYKSNSDAVTKYGNETMSYDIDGNAIRYRGYTMEWVKGGQLSRLSGNGIAMSFKYDNGGIRTKKTVNGVDTEYFYVGDTLVSQKTGNEVINFAYTAGGAPYGFTYNGTSYFYLTNIQGDIIGIYDTNGNVVVEYIYDSWGKLISITGSLADTIGVKNPLRYRGYYYDTETSLYYLQARYYDPDTGRFICPDTLLIAGNDYIQGTNRYAYCYNNPVMYVDPTGFSAYAATEDSAKMAATIAMVLALGNIGFTWFASISELTYDNVYKVTEAVGNSINWFYDVYGLEVSLENTRKLMNKITEMCDALSSVVGECALDLMTNYFTADKIGALFAVHGDKISKKIADIESDIRINGGEFLLSAFAAGITTGIGFAISFGGVIYQLIDIMKTYDEYNLWKEIISLNG